MEDDLALVDVDGVERAAAHCVDGKLLSMVRSKSAEALAAAFVASKAGIAVAACICDVSPRRLFHSVAHPCACPRHDGAVPRRRLRGGERVRARSGHTLYSAVYHVHGACVSPLCPDLCAPYVYRAPCPARSAMCRLSSVPAPGPAVCRAVIM